MTADEVRKELIINNWKCDIHGKWTHKGITNITHWIADRDIQSHPLTFYSHAINLMSQANLLMLTGQSNLFVPQQNQSSSGMTVVTAAYVREFLKLNSWTLDITSDIWSNINKFAHIHDNNIGQDPNGNFQWIKDRTALPHVSPGSLMTIGSGQGGLSLSTATLNGLNFTFSTGVSALPRHGIVFKSKCECGGTKANTSHSTWCPVYKPFK